MDGENDYGTKRRKEGKSKGNVVRHDNHMGRPKLSIPTPANISHKVRSEATHITKARLARCKKVS